MSFHSYHIKTLCRGCLVADRKMANVELYKAEFKDLTGITISPTDGLPQWLCYECIALLKKCVGFGNKVMKSHYKLCEYVLDKVPFVSDKESSPQLSRSPIDCYVFPACETEQQELIIKTEENEMDLPVMIKVESMPFAESIETCHFPIVTNVESIRVTPETETPHYEDNNTENVCRDERAQLADASKLSGDDDELDNKEDLSELKWSALTIMATTGSSSPTESLLSNNKNINLLNSGHEERTEQTEIEEEMPVTDDTPDDKIENDEKENSDNDTIEVWCFSIDEQGELTMKSQRREPKRHNKVQTKKASLVLKNTVKNAAIQARKNADEHSDRSERDDLDEVQYPEEPQSSVLNINITSTLQKEGDEEKVNVDGNDSVKVHTRGNAKNVHERRDKCYTDKRKFRTLIFDKSKRKPFICDVCMKDYATKANLTVHKRLHSGERPFKCDVCMQRFICKEFLKNHYRLHTGERPYKCDVCMKTFARRCNLHVHYRLHTGVTPYKCDICMKTFKFKTSFNLHLRSHTAKK